MGKEVTMFFTFWGLNILKSKDKPKVTKDTMEKMFDVMLTSTSRKITIITNEHDGNGTCNDKTNNEKT